jgi:beta-galactosidase
MVDFHSGRGRTRLIGTFPGYGRFHHPEDDSPFFRDLLPWAGKTQHVRSDSPDLTARLHDGDGGTYLWVTNAAREARTATLTLSGAWGSYVAGPLIWGDGRVTVEDRTITLTVGPRNAVIVRLDRV